MAEKEEEKTETTEGEGEGEGKKKGLPIKTIGIVLALLIAEGVGVVAVLSMGGTPETVKGGELELTPMDELETLGELLIVREKFPNHSSGRVWLWDVEVQVQIKEKNREYVENTLSERQAEIKTGVGRIIRTAHNNQLQEPNLETMTRQITQYLREVFGSDADGEPRVEKVLLPQFVGFPADF